MGSLGAVDLPLQYPTVRRDKSVIDHYHGVKIADPYRWLEDPDSEETKEFVQKQVELMQSVLKECDDTRGKLADKITKLVMIHLLGEGTSTCTPITPCFKPKTCSMCSLDGEPEALLDPNTLSEDGTVV